MAKPEVLNSYVRLMQDIYKPSNLTDIELQLCNDFFNSLPPVFQKYVFNTMVNRLKYWPKPAELNQIYDEVVKKKNQKNIEFLSVKNAEKCPICNDSGFYEYYRLNGKVLTDKEYFANIKKHFGKCSKHICTCKCNVGQSKENNNHFYRYSDLFPDDK